MVKITVTPPNKPSFSKVFDVLSDAQDFLMLLREQGYVAAQQKDVADSCKECGQSLVGRMCANESCAKFVPLI